MWRVSTSAPTIICSSLSSGGYIDVSIRRRDGRFVVEVSNTGALLPKEAETRVFDRFFRARKAAAELAKLGRGRTAPNLAVSSTWYLEFVASRFRDMGVVAVPQRERHSGAQPGARRAIAIFKHQSSARGASDSTDD